MRINRIDAKLSELENRQSFLGIPIPGATGLVGQQGQYGQQGDSGIQGNDNDQQGNQGNQGAQGTQGSVGLGNLSGSIGFQGSQGQQGLIGLNGFNGSQGISGLVGSVGNNGNQGQQGQQGNNGANGMQGLQGAQGLRGTQGLAATLPADNTVAFFMLSSPGTQTIPWPLTLSGTQSPIIFITMSAGGGGSGGTDVITLVDVPAPGGSGGGGGFVRRLPIRYESTMTGFDVSIGAGGGGGLGIVGNPTAGLPGGDTTFKINFSGVNNTGINLRCFGGGGGNPGGLAANYPQMTSGYGGGVRLDASGTSGNLPRIICQNAVGHVINTIDQSTAIPVESSKINGYFESGSGGVCALNIGGTVTGAPNVSNLQLATPSDVITGSIGPGGSSGIPTSGRGANTIDFIGESTGLPGLTGNNGVFIMEYLI